MPPGMGDAKGLGLRKNTHSVSANVTGYVLVMLLLFVLHIDSVVVVFVVVSPGVKRGGRSAHFHTESMGNTLAAGRAPLEFVIIIQQHTAVFVDSTTLPLRVYLLFAGDGVAPAVIFLADAKGRLGVMNEILLEVVRILGGVSPEFVANSVQHLDIKLLHLQRDI